MSQGLLKTLEIAHGALADYGVDHALIGGLALGGHGVHRATLDVDLLVDGARRTETLTALRAVGFEVAGEERQVERLLAALEARGRAGA